MDEMDFTISASSNFGNFMWEYPDEIKKLLMELRKLGGEEAVRGIMESQKNNILMLLHIQLGVLHAGPLAPTLAANVNKCLGELAKEGLNLIRSNQ